jgi:hypothetical protein
MPLIKKAIKAIGIEMDALAGILPGELLNKEWFD